MKMAMWEKHSFDDNNCGMMRMSWFPKVALWDAGTDCRAVGV